MMSHAQLNLVKCHILTFVNSKRQLQMPLNPMIGQKLKIKNQLCVDTTSIATLPNNLECIFTKCIYSRVWYKD